MSKFYPATSLTGGGTGSLDSIDGDLLADGDGALVITDGVSYSYHLDASSGAAESSPDIISPDSNPGNKRWILQEYRMEDVVIADGGVVASATYTDAVTINAANIVINEAGNDRDFRIEASGAANALFVEGSSGNVGLGTATPDTIASNTWTDVDLQVKSVLGSTLAIVGDTQALLVLSDEDATANSKVYSMGSVGDSLLVQAWNDNETAKGTRLSISSTGVVDIPGITDAQFPYMSASGFADSGFSYDGSGTYTLTSTSSSVPDLRIENVNTDSSGGSLTFVKTSTGSAADNDKLAEYYYYGLDSGDNSLFYVLTTVMSGDITDGDESGRIRHEVRMDGTVRNFVDIKGYNGSVGQGEIIFNEDGQDIDTRIEASGAANALFVEGSSGDVGLGTNDPDAMLHIEASNAARNVRLRFTDTRTTLTAGQDIGVIEFETKDAGSPGVGADIRAKADGAAGEVRLEFATGTGGSKSEAFRIESDGDLFLAAGKKLGVGVTPSAAATIQVADNAGVDALFIDQNDSTQNKISISIDHEGTGDQIVSIGSGGSFYVKTDGDCENTNNAYGAISDVRCKENIVDATPKLDDILALKVRNFNMKGSDLKQIGLVADEVEDVFPALIRVSDKRKWSQPTKAVAAIRYTEEDEIPEGKEIGDIRVPGKRAKEPEVIEGPECHRYEDQKSLKYSVLVPILIKGIQELERRVVDQEVLIDAHKTLIQDLYNQVNA